MTSQAELLTDPVAFVRGVLGHKVWKKQSEILRSVAANKQTAVKACHGSSKTFTASEALLWWLSRYSDGIVVTTAPTWFQVENLLWQEVHKAIATSRVAFPKPLSTELTIAPGNYAIGLSTNETVRFQGFHGDHVLFILDEAPGVRPGIWEHLTLQYYSNDSTVSKLDIAIRYVQYQFSQQHSNCRKEATDGLPNVSQ